MRVFLALAVAHILSDFPWQTERMVAQKQEGARGTESLGPRRFIGYATHGSVLLAASILFVSPWLSRRLVAAVFALTFAHLLLDYLKCRYVSQTTVTILFGDQLVHLSIIFAGVYFLGVEQWGVVMSGFERIWQTYRDPGAIVTSGYVISVWVGGTLVRELLNAIGPPKEIDVGLRDAGMRIGQLERFIVTTLTVLDQYNAIAFVFAAKSIARFKKIEEMPTFAEYYLAGTLASASFGILVGLGIKAGLAILGRGN